MMKTIIAVTLLLCIGVVCAGRSSYSPKGYGNRGTTLRNPPFLYLGGAGRNGVQAFQLPASAFEFVDDDDEYVENSAFSVVQDDEDDENSYDDDFEDENSLEDDDDESEYNSNLIELFPLRSGNALNNRVDSDDVVELEEIQDGDDTNEQAAIVLPRQVLENIRTGNYITLVDESEGRAQKRRQSFYRGPARFRGNRRRRRPNQRRRRRPAGVRFVKRRPNRRGGNRRRRRPVMI